MRKKGSYILAQEQLLTLVRVFLVLIISVVVVLIVAHYLTREVNVDEAQTFMVSSRLLSEECFGYSGATGLQYGVLDSSKITVERLTRCITYNENSFGAKVVLPDQEMFYDEEFYLTNYLLCEQDERKMCGSTNLYVLINDGDKLIPSNLNVEVVIVE